MIQLYQILFNSARPSRRQFSRKPLDTLLVLGCSLAGLLASLLLTAQESVPLRTNQSISLPPPMPVPKPPTEYFRQLLATSPGERERLLARETPERQNLLRNKLRQYEAMSAERREQHLRTLELRWYLLSLMPVSASNRMAWLAPLQAPERRLIVGRLMYWDLLPSDLQQEVLTNEVAIRIVVSEKFGVPFLATDRTNLPPAQRQKLEAGIAHWESLPAAAQQRIYGHFKQLFELPDTRSLAATSRTNLTTRQSLEKAIADFNRLPPADRARTIAGFCRYADLPLQQQEEFLTGVRRWLSMSEQEREQWRQAAKKRPPPLPPELPPMPPGLKLNRYPLPPPIPIRLETLTTSNQP